MRDHGCFCPRASLRCSKGTRARAHCVAVLAVGREKKYTLVESEIEDEMLMMMMIGMIGEVRQCLYMMMMRMIVFPKGACKANKFHHALRSGDGSLTKVPIGMPDLNKGSHGF